MKNHLSPGFMGGEEPTIVTVSIQRIRQIWKTSSPKCNCIAVFFRPWLTQHSQSILNNREPPFCFLKIGHLYGAWEVTEIQTNAVLWKNNLFLLKRPSQFYIINFIIQGTALYHWQKEHFVFRLLTPHGDPETVPLHLKFVEKKHLKTQGKSTACAAILSSYITASHL